MLQQFWQVLFLNLLLVGDYLLLGLNLEAGLFVLDVTLDIGVLGLHHTITHLLRLGLLDVFRVHQGWKKWLDLHCSGINDVRNLNCVLANAFHFDLFFEPENKKINGLISCSLQC